MKNFKEYLKESISGKKYEFRVKIAGDVSSEQEDRLKAVLEKYSVDNFKKLAKTPIQALPLDFPQVKNCEVNIYEISLNYPTTQQELTEYLVQNLEVSRQMLVVRRPGEPSEEYQVPAEPRDTALLNDPDYKEAGSPKFEDYYGDKYNSGFVKELNELLKLQRRERGEVTPTSGSAEFNTDKPAGTKTPVMQAPDPRR